MKLYILLLLVVSANAGVSNCGREDLCLKKIDTYQTYKDLIPWSDDLNNPQFCRDGNLYSICLSNPSEACSLPKYLMPKALMDKICDINPETKPWRDNLFASKCVTDANERSAAIAKVGTLCSKYVDSINIFEMGRMLEGDACRLTIRIYYCVWEVFEAMCGSEVIDLIDHLYAEMTKNFLICSEELRRGLLMFKRYLNFT